ncbi:MAG: hypothetical protein CME65_02515 [Halobacteriovoraceae bacterium]|nr:hypothetical protein [Halobacteriovoraceae bacterium]|tara:strand:- start:1156 stop:1575 length:420 start_codon:yes stop_codon:yes gene_type:complete
MSLESLLTASGVIHFGILSGGLAMTKVLNWQKELKKVDPLSQHIIWTHGAYIWFVILLFGVLSFFFPNDLISGSKLGFSMSLFIALFWFARLVIQLFIFDASKYLKSPILAMGYHSLTICFGIFSIIYGYAAYVGWQLL